MAVSRGHVEIIRHLLDRGANMETTDKVMLIKTSRYSFNEYKFYVT